MSIDINQIKNQELNALALEVDSSSEKPNGYIDTSEINLFIDKAISLYNDKKCTIDDIKQVFNINEESEMNSGIDIFTKMDSLNNNSIKSEGNTKIENQKKINEIKSKIAMNDKKLKLYEMRLSQKEISNNQYLKDIKGKESFMNKSEKIILPIMAASSILSAVATFGIFMDVTVGAVLFAGGATAIAALSILAFYISIKKENERHQESLRPENQERIRNEYQEVYLKILQENEQLKAELANLQK